MIKTNKMKPNLSDFQVWATNPDGLYTSPDKTLTLFGNI